MRVPVHDVKAAARTVSFTLGSNLSTGTKRLGTSASLVAEAALSRPSPVRWRSAEHFHHS